MTLKEVSNKLFVLAQINWSGFTEVEQYQIEKELHRYIHQFHLEVKKESSIELLQSILEQEKKSLFLPITCLIKLYQRFLTLSQDEKSTYLEFAHYLKLHGPNWDGEADEVKKLVEQEQFEEAYEIVRKIKVYEA